MSSVNIAMDPRTSSWPDDLRELVQEWFVFVTTFRRDVQLGALAKPAEGVPMAAETLIRGELTRRLAALRARGSTLAGYAEAEKALVYWCDEVLLTCGWSDRGTWVRITLELQTYRTQIGGKHFFELLDAELNGASRSDVLEIFSKCLSLGFQGIFAAGNPSSATLVGLRNRVAKRMNPILSHERRFCRSAYQGLDESNLVKLPVLEVARWSLAVVAVLTGIFCVAFIAARVRLDDFEAAAVAVSRPVD